MSTVDDFDRLTSYWRGLQAQAGGAVPSRVQFNPADVKRLLPFIFILERKGPGVMHVRLCGTALDDLSGFTITGRNYLDVCPDEHRQLYETLTHVVLAVPCGMKLDREVTYENGRMLPLTSLLLPLADSSGLARYVIGMMKPARVLQKIDLYNGKAQKAELHNVTYIDIGCGLPAGQADLTIPAQNTDRDLSDGLGAVS